MKVAITGASGFLGRHVMAALQSGAVSPAPGVLETVELRCLSRRRPNAVPDGVEWIEADVLRPESLASAFDGVDVLVHAAGRVSHDPADAADLFDVHVHGTRHALTAARAAGVRRCVYLSSSGTVAVQEEVGEPTEVPALDEDAPRPLEVVSELPYYRSKLFAEELALELGDDAFAVGLPEPLAPPRARRRPARTPPPSRCGCSSRGPYRHPRREAWPSSMCGTWRWLS